VLILNNEKWNRVDKDDYRFINSYFEPVSIALGRAVPTAYTSVFAKSKEIL
jgi:hypothetical protein